MLAPFQKISETIQSTLDKASASQTSAMSESVSSSVSAAADKAATAPRPSPTGNLPLLAAGVGIALGAIGAFVTAALSALFSATAVVSANIGELATSVGLPDAATSVLAGASYPFALLLVILGVILVPVLIYAVPVSLATWFRLRRRNLSVLLEGSGWAVNTRLYLDRDLAVQLTTRPAPPR